MAMSTTLFRAKNTAYTLHKVVDKMLQVIAIYVTAHKIQCGNHGYHQFDTFCMQTRLVHA